MKPIKEVGCWQEQLSSSGKRYYYNRETEVSQWEKPDEWKEFERKLEDQQRRDQQAQQAAMYATTTQQPNITMAQMTMFPGQLIPPPPPPFPMGHIPPGFNSGYSNPYGPGPMNPMPFMGVVPPMPSGHHETSGYRDGHHSNRTSRNSRDYSRPNRDERDKDRGATHSRDQSRNHHGAHHDRHNGHVDETERSRKRSDTEQRGGDDQRPVKVPRSGSNGSAEASLAENEKCRGGDDSANQSEGGKQSGSQPMDIEEDKDTTPLPDEILEDEIVDETCSFDLQKYYSPELAANGWKSLKMEGVNEQIKKVNDERIDVMNILYEHSRLIEKLYSARILVHASNFHASILNERLRHLRKFGADCDAKIRAINNSNQVGPLNMADITNTTSSNSHA